MKPITIALDAMGGDYGISVTVPAALDSLADHPNLTLMLVGDAERINAALAAYAPEHEPSVRDRFKIVHASEVVEMDDSPALALRHKKDSSLRVAVNLVKEQQANACISAGNTGALVATARFVLKTLPGIDRPALVVAMPTEKGVAQMLDLGANVDCTPDQLLQFAIMGSIMANTVLHIESPKIALLNIGKEEIKGNDLVKGAHALLLKAGSMINYAGFIESDQIYSGEIDVVVCDGFNGNIALKSIEGVAHVISYFLKLEFNRNILTKLVGLMARPIMKRAAAHIDPRGYNGASLLGLNGIVLKSHGSADRKAMSYAINQAIMQIDFDIPSRIKKKVADIIQGVNTL